MLTAYSCFCHRHVRAGLAFLLVLCAHWMALGGATTAWSSTSWPPMPPAMVLETRLLPSEAPALPADLAPSPARAPAKRRHVARTDSSAAPAPEMVPAAPGQAPALQVTEPTAPVQLAAASKTDETPTASKPPVSASTLPGRPPILPESVRLLYDIKGEIKHIPLSANGELQWRQDGKTYDARLEIKIFLLGSRVQTSKGLVGPQGLEPVRFGDKVRSEVAAHFERDKGKVTYSANTPDEVLQPGAQDQLSIFFQLAGMLAADPERYKPGTQMSFQAVGPRSSETWVFKLADPETITLPGGKLRTIRLGKDPVSEYDSRAEVWLAPDLNYLPVRIRLTQGNGDVVDQLWRATERPTASP